MDPYGRLVLTLPNGEEQVFELAKERVGLGRAADNDIRLRDTKVSRNHARLELQAGYVTLVDLGSANGTFVNQSQVERARLSPGDQLRIGRSMLRFEMTVPEEVQELTWIDSDQDLDNTLAQETVAMTINDTSQPRLVVHTPDLTWEVPLTEDRIVIGRSPEVEIHIPQAKVSREHAQLERHGEGFTLRDLGSSNGTWMGSQAVETHALRDGDSFQVGGARLVYKQPFIAEELTLVEPVQLTKEVPRKPVVVVPGLMGSQLWSGDELLWPNVHKLFSNPERFALPEREPLTVNGIVEKVVIVPNLIKMEQYNRLGDYLVEGLGYQRGVDLLEFAYDWRQDVREAAKKLAQTIDGWQVSGPVTLIGHSLGTLVSRYYVERLGGARRVERVILIGGPHLGVPKAVTSLLISADLLPFGMMGDRLRQVLVTFPSMYQILPIYPCAFDQHGNPIDLMADDSWLPEDQRPLLRTAREFRAELGTTSSVPALSIFGYGNKTVTEIAVQRGASGAWKEINFSNAPQGDDTIPERSTILEGSDIHPVQQYHASLYIDPDVKMRLKIELTRHMAG